MELARADRVSGCMLRLLYRGTGSSGIAEAWHTIHFIDDGLGLDEVGGPRHGLQADLAQALHRLLHGPTGIALCACSHASGCTTAGTLIAS